MFELVEKYWTAFKRVKGSDLKNVVPNLNDIDNIKLTKGRESETMLELTFSDLAMAVQNGEYISTLKKYIISYFKNFADVKIRNLGNDDLTIYITNIRAPAMAESTVKVLKRKGNSLVSTMKCISGPKKNQRVGNAATCTSPLDTNKSISRKISSKANKTKIKNKKQLTSIKSAVIHRRLVNANKARKKARGGMF